MAQNRARLTASASRRSSIRDAIIGYDDDDVRLLSDDEIQSFLDDLDHNGDRRISYEEMEAKLDAVHEEIAPVAQAHNLHHESKADEARHAFLRSLIGVEAGSIPREEMEARVREWRIPSMKQESEGEEAEQEYLRRFTLTRRFRSYWSVRGPEIVFIALVVSMTLAFALWQMIKYITQTQYRAGFGWGVVMAKTCAGALYSVFFFLILSMSRYFSTFLRRWYTISRFINWDLSQRFHIIMSCLALALATLHAIGHLTGSFVFGSRANRQAAVANVLGPEAVPRRYVDYVRSTPGWTGLVAFGLFWILAGLSMPRVRKWNYEVFQLGHLLMYPIIGLLCAHGTAALFQWPMLGYFLAFPTLLIVVERLIRVIVGFRSIPATIRILDYETVEIKADIPPERVWKYKPGQYVFLQVPQLSRFQWHPFTVSVCLQRQVQLHIKTDGNWTRRLRAMVPEGKQEADIHIGLNGPFGAPAERFYDFSHTILVGAGIGVTPFSGILADLQAKDNRLHGGPSDFEVGKLSPQQVQEAKPVRVDVHPSRSSTSDRTITNEKPEQGEHCEVGSKGARQPNGPAKAVQAVASSGDRATIKGDSVDQNTDNDLTLTRTLTRGLSRIGSRSRPRSRRGSRRNSLAAGTRSAFAEDYRRVDFHWMVRDRNHLGWFSNLLNTISRSQLWHRAHDGGSGGPALPHLDIRLSTHVTQKRKGISTHIYRWLLELHRTKDHPESPLTGLINPTHYGRPDFVKILDRHYEDMVRFRYETGFGSGSGNNVEKLKVGVFFCGTPVVGEILADRCRLLTSRGEVEGTKIRYHFMMEVFG
ncbi:hypothetical protein IAU60_003435 [Kwoniella sp. DSM 27419]